MNDCWNWRQAEVNWSVVQGICSWVRPCGVVGPGESVVRRMGLTQYCF
jgi:hypothetical protein